MKLLFTFYASNIEGHDGLSTFLEMANEITFTNFLEEEIPHVGKFEADINDDMICIKMTDFLFRKHTQGRIFGGIKMDRLRRLCFADSSIIGVGSTEELDLLFTAAEMELEVEE